MPPSPAKISRNPSHNDTISSFIEHTSETHIKGSDEYETLRLGYQNGYVPSRNPTEIVIPHTIPHVVLAVKRACQEGMLIGVRSGGHQWTASGLLEGGLLIDMRYVNREVGYDPATEIVSFGPAVTGAEISKEMIRVDRFFPHGHTPSVAAGGFLLAGGQGWFFRGWGLTAESWVLKMQVVTASGEVIVASPEENADLFWAATGCGQGFFGIVTKFWCRTIPARKLYQQSLLFNIGEGYETVLQYLLKVAEATPKEGTDITFVTFYSDKYDPERKTDEIGDSSTLVMAASAVTYTDSQEQAISLLNAFSDSQIPTLVKQYLINATGLHPTTWAELFAAQDAFVTLAHGERWQCSSILSDPDLEHEKLIASIKPMLCDLPTRRSAGCLVAANIRPNEAKMAGSLPQEYYAAAMYCWTDSQEDDEMHQKLCHVNGLARPISCGLYVADFNTKWPVRKVMSDTAFAKFTRIRLKWDPEERFQGFRGLNEGIEVDKTAPEG